MEIERINDHTVKFYISYIDIEERGFKREEIWYNRERSEELFWEMMDEVHQEEDFILDGPLWIQVQALDKGLEILVTRAQLSKDGQKFEISIPEDKLKDLPLDERFEDLIDQQFSVKDIEEDYDEILEFVIEFKDFEDVIALSKVHGLEDVDLKLYSYKNIYYVFMRFLEDVEEEEVDNLLSILLEYGQETKTTIHILEEYGKTIIENNLMEELRKYFS
ncbi:adaptor protein MecA [Niallia sp. NCCP-28]|uniref:adaptor protein MecA n=1 Tax=Niallia sp. NCCP-28 TaxID=2934712 RepID=UPI002084E646|nr:adaptor protein MecA [Niallia sp. NCCP-28]GKU81802.1 adapter protein MecA 1 [Niallia sp. NCCP-28]